MGAGSCLPILILGNSFIWENSMLRKLCCFYCKIGWFVVKEKLSLNMLELFFSFSWDWSSLKLYLFLKMSTRKLEFWLILWSFFLLRLLVWVYKSTMHSFIENFMSGLVLEYVGWVSGTAVLHWLPLLKLWLIVKQEWKWVSWQSVEVLLILLPPRHTIIATQVVLELFLIL